MFKFLKDKLKGALGKLTKKVEKAPEEKITVEKEVKIEDKLGKQSEKVEKKAEEKEITKPEPELKDEKVLSVKEKLSERKKIEPEVKPEEKKPEKAKPEEKKPEPKGFFSKLKERFTEEEQKEPEHPEPEIKVSEKIEQVEEPVKEPIKEKLVKKDELVKPEQQEEPEKKGFFQKITETITTKKISESQFDELFWDLELALLENNVAVEVIEKIKKDLKSNLLEKPVPRSKVSEIVGESLHNSIEDLFIVPEINLLALNRQKKPLVICFVGINGSGKTTSIAKVAKYFLNNKLSVVLAAADTFRAAAIDQLQLHADKLGVKLIKHDYGSDPAAVAFDAVKHAEASRKDVVLIDTAGRLHSNVNLIDEMKKIVRVAKPDLKIFVGESITGNDCVEQAKKFDEAVGIDGIILSKADVDDKGGAAISVSYVTKKPILFLGIGQEYDDLQAFDKDKLIAGIGL